PAHEVPALVVEEATLRDDLSVAVAYDLARDEVETPCRHPDLVLAGDEDLIAGLLRDAMPPFGDDVSEVVVLELRREDDARDPAFDDELLESALESEAHLAPVVAGREHTVIPIVLGAGVELAFLTAHLLRARLAFEAVGIEPDVELRSRQLPRRRGVPHLERVRDREAAKLLLLGIPERIPVRD